MRLGNAYFGALCLPAGARELSLLERSPCRVHVLQKKLCHLLSSFVPLTGCEEQELTGKAEMPQLSAVACSVLDARSPEQFVFIPDWMMKALRLRPR